MNNEDQVREAGYKELQAEYKERGLGNPVGVKKDELVSAIVDAMEHPAPPIDVPDLPPVEEVLAEVAEEAAEEEAPKSRAALRRERDAEGAAIAMEAAEAAPELSEEARKAGFKPYDVERFKGVGGRYARSGRCSIPRCTTGGDGQKGTAIYVKYPKAYCWEHALAAFRRANVEKPFEDDAHNAQFGFASEEGGESDSE